MPFCSRDYNSILSYISYISPKALKAIYKHIDKSLYLKTYSQSTRSSYYRSVCRRCGAAQGDNFVIHEHNSPFHPVRIEDFEKIKFFRIDKAIQLSAGSHSIDY